MGEYQNLAKFRNLDACDEVIRLLRGHSIGCKCAEGNRTVGYWLQVKRSEFGKARKLILSSGTDVLEEIRSWAE